MDYCTRLTLSEFAQTTEGREHKVWELLKCDIASAQLTTPPIGYKAHLLKFGHRIRFVVYETMNL